jgi:transcriptional regulator with XRE-family HTH domain
MDSENECEAAVEEALPATPGAMLRAAREEKRLTLDQVAAETRIPIRHLASIEEDRFDALPSRTYAIGFSRQFARVVGLDEDQIIDAVRDEMAGADSHRSMVGGGMEPGDPAKLPSSGLAWFGGISALILAIGAIAFFSTYYGAGADPDSLLADRDEQQAADAKPKPADKQAAQPSESGQVVLTAIEDGVWVRVYEEGGERLYEKLMAKDERYEVPTTVAEPRINTGRPDLIAITIDGKSVPKLSEEPAVLGDTPISAKALLARAKQPTQAETADN